MRLMEGHLDFIFRFITKYFEENVIEYYQYPDKGFFVIERELEAFIDKEDKIQFLKQKYTDIYPKSDSDIEIFSIYKGHGKYISWSNYVHYMLVKYPDFVEEFYSRIVRQQNCDASFFNSRNFSRFYDFFSNMKDDGCYTDFNELTKFLEAWSFYSKKNFQLNKIKERLTSLEKNNKLVISPSNDKTFTQIWNSDISLDHILSLLIREEIVEFIDGKYYIRIPDKFKKKGFKAFTCAIGLSLNEKGYLKFCHNTDICSSLNNLFENADVIKQDFDNLLKSRRKQDYLEYTSFL